jgi:hypothetical protein
MFLVFIRGLVLVIILLWLFYMLNPAVECAISERWRYMKDHFQKVSDFLDDRQHEVPPSHRRPPLRYAAYRAQQAKQMQQRYLTSRAKFDHLGTVMTDGPNGSLPAGAVWHNGMIRWNETK